MAPTADYTNPACEATARELEAVAKKLWIDPANMIVAWLLHLAPNVRAVVGPRDAGQLRAMWPAADIALPADAVRRIGEIVSMRDYLGIR